LSDTQTYYFGVQALDVYGQRSDFSPSVILPANALALPDFGTDGTAGTTGISDIVWQHSTGLLAVWYMDRQGRATSQPVMTPNSVGDPNWRIVGTGDFSGDRRPDLVWQNTNTGQIVTWLMQGATLRQPVYIDTVSDKKWKIAAVGDMNADHHADLIWQHENGNLVVWYMEGTRYRSSAAVSGSGARPPSTWRLVGANDIDLDGRADLLWQNISGALSVWLMNGVTLRSSSNLNPSSINPIWRAAALADYNADGRPDIIWQRNDGYLAVWFMNGLNMASSPAITPSWIPSQWQVVGPK
jgi:hypothetical protein